MTPFTVGSNHSDTGVVPTTISGKNTAFPDSPPDQVGRLAPEIENDNAVDRHRRRSQGSMRTIVWRRS
jgi:hypothetical protein